MKTKLFLTLTVLSAVVFTACKTHCPGFPKELLVYFPYRYNDTLNFINQSNDTMTFYVSQLFLDEEYSFGPRCKCACGIETYFEWVAEGYDKDTNYIVPRYYIDGTISANNANAFEEISVRMTFKGSKGSEFVYTPGSLSTIFDLNLITLKDRGCDTCYLIVEKNVGITEFHDVLTNNTWNKIP